MLPIVSLYHMMGWILIPLNGKVPPKHFRLKEMFTKNTQEPEEVAGYFPPNYQGNIGIVTGQGSDLVVADLDGPADGRWAKQRFEKTPFVVKTGKQGCHLYYRYPSGGYEVRCKTRILGLKLDLRADGGYVVAPPSVHPETQRSYRWMTPLEQLSLDNMPEFDPVWLPQQKTSTTAPSSPLSSPPPTTASRRNTSDSIKRARNYMSHITCISGRSAHNTLFRACCKLVDLFGLTETELQHLLAEWNTTNCFDENQQPYPWSQNELDHKISDALKTINNPKPKGT